MRIAVIGFGAAAIGFIERKWSTCVVRPEVFLLKFFKKNLEILFLLL